VIGCWVTSIYPRPGSPGKVPTTFFRPGPVRRLPRARLVTPVTYSPDNILSSNCGELEDGFLCAPVPNPSLTQVDGYWAHVRPLTPGTYKLQTFGEAPYFQFALQITYTLTVVGPNDQ